MFVVAPIIVRFQNRFKRYAELFEIDCDSLPEEIQKTFEPNGEKLFRLGFEPRGYFYQFDQMPNTTSYLSFWVNEKAGETALMAHISLKNQNGITKKTTLEFGTEFSNGISLCTNNSDLGVFNYPPEKTVLRLPNNQNVKQLYRVHLKKLEKLRVNAEKLLPVKGMEVFDLTTAMEKELRTQVDLGIMFLDEPENAYRPSWKGAFLMTWRLLPPTKNIRQLKMRRKTNALLKEGDSRQPLISQYYK